MKIAVLGTGMVGQALARKLIDLGHTVTMGSRNADSEPARKFASEAGDNAGAATFAEATANADLVYIAAKGDAVLDIIQSALPENFGNKIVVDVSNPLDFSNGFPPTLIPELSNTTSLGEAVQAALSDARVVKTLNTVNCDIMVEPTLLDEPGDIFVSGNDPAAKAEVIKLLNHFGWPNPIDLGDITTARATEQYLPFWVRAMGPMGGMNFNIKLVR